MPDQPPADPIAQLKQSIASLEEQQRTLGVDLSASIQPLRELLAGLEQTASLVAPNQSGGITAEADRINIGGDAVGRDKITSTQNTWIRQFIMSPWAWVSGAVILVAGLIIVAGIFNAGSLAALLPTPTPSPTPRAAAKTANCVPSSIVFPASSTADFTASAKLTGDVPTISTFL